FHDAAYAGRVDRHGLLRENMLTCFHRGLQMERSKAGRRCEDDEVDPRLQHLLIGVEPDKAALFRYVHLLMPQLLEVVPGILQVVLEQIAHGDQLDVRSRANALLGRAAPAPAARTAAADETDTDQVVARLMHV